MRKLVVLITILLISSLVIFYKFGQIPKNLSFDEVEFAKLALSLDGKAYLPYSPLATGHSTLYFYIILLSFKIFGISNFALRFPSALFGVLNGIIFYLIFQIVFASQKGYMLHVSCCKNKLLITVNQFLPFLLTLVFITSRWYFNFARFSFEATFLLFFELIAIYFLFRYIDTSKLIFLILTGIFSGLAYNSYTPGRIFFLLPLIVIGLNLFKNPSQWQYLFKPIIVFLILFILIIAPLSLYFLQNPDDRFDKQFYPKNSEMKIIEKVDYFVRNIRSAALMFNFKGDINGRHNYPGKPALNPILGLLFIVGLLLTIKNIKKNPNQVFLAYFIISLVPALLTYPWENPNMLRMFTVIPSVIYFVGISIGFIENLNKPLVTPAIKKMITTVVFLLLLISSLYEIRTYFMYQTKVFPQAFEVKYDLKTALNKKLPD